MTHSEQPDMDRTTLESLTRQWIELGLLITWVTKQSNKEIDSLSEYLEEKTEDLVDNFRDISGKAQGQSQTVNEIVESSTNVIVGDRTVPLVEVVEKLDRLITCMIDDVIDTSKQAMGMVYIMQQAVADSKKVTEALEDIFKITHVTKYLSINALIEAEQAGGNAGKSFGVVAKEVRDLSFSTKELAERMDEQVNGLANKLKESFKLLEIIAAKDMTEQIQMKESISETMAALIAQSERQKAILEQTATSSTDISSTVSRLIMTMQFQDYMKQRMQHLTEAASGVQERVYELLENSRSVEIVTDFPKDPPENIVNELLERFSLSKIKNDFANGLEDDAQNQTMGTAPSSGATGGGDDDDGGDIELF